MNQEAENADAGYFMTAGGSFWNASVNPAGHATFAPVLRSQQAASRPPNYVCQKRLEPEERFG